MTIEKTLDRLKKLHEGYAEDVAFLTQKLADVQKDLDDAKTKQIQTFDAINALEGKPTLAKLFEKVNTGLSVPASTPVDLATISTQPAPNTNLPAPEPGMKWIQNEKEEWVLVSINPPAPLFVPGVFSGELDDLPKIDENTGFEDPSTFL